MEEIRLYSLLAVNYSYLVKNGDSFTFRTENKVFKTMYISHIPVVITNEEFEQIKSEQKKYKTAKQTPLLHKIRKQAIQYLKDTNAFKN